MTRKGQGRLLIATSNPGKLAEFRELLPPTIDCLGLHDLGLASPPETGATLRENAELKAVAAARASGMLALADDSGLEVVALGGAPGVRSARYAGEPADDSRNRRALLAAMAKFAPAAREGTFVCAVAIASPEGLIATAHGKLTGSIAYSERGDQGFGYDALFELPDGRTLAELTPAEKNAISHRANAVRTILPRLHAAIDVHGARPRIGS